MASKTSDAELLSRAIAERLGLEAEDLRAFGVPALIERYLADPRRSQKQVSGVWRSPEPDAAHDWSDEPTPVHHEPLLERLSKE